MSTIWKTPRSRLITRMLTTAVKMFWNSLNTVKAPTLYPNSLAIVLLITVL